jgi:hypothetical protein
MESELYAVINITSKELNLDILTAITSLKPHRTHQIGDKAITGHTLDYSMWDFCTEIIDTWDTEIVTNKLIEYLAPNFVALRKFVIEHHCGVSIYVVVNEIGDTVPALCLNKAILDMAHELNTTTVYFDGIYKYPHEACTTCQKWKDENSEEVR